MIVFLFISYTSKSLCSKIPMNLYWPNNWGPARQTDLTATTIEAFEWLFLVRFSLFGDYISLLCRPPIDLFILAGNTWVFKTNIFICCYSHKKTFNARTTFYKPMYIQSIFLTSNNIYSVNYHMAICFIWGNWLYLL